jgi:hypothetical protein
MEIEREWVDTTQLFREPLKYVRIEGVLTVEFTVAGLRLCHGYTEGWNLSHRHRTLRYRTRAG